MKVLRIAIALLLTLALLYIACINSRGRPEFISHSENGFTFEMTTVPKALELDHTRIQLRISGDLGPDLTPVYRQSRTGQDDRTRLYKYATVPLQVEDSAAGLYYTEVSTGARGKRLYYYFEIRDAIGGLRASLKADGGKPFVLKFIGKVPAFVLTGHVILMFATVFFVILAGLHALRLVRGDREVRSMSLCFFLAAIVTFLGCYPFGFAMNHYAFATVWEGVPFGTDATDNKTQLLFIYLVFMAVASIGSLTRGKIIRDVFSPRTLGWFGIGAFVLMLLIYLIPHSIQFSPQLTRAVCYSFIGLVALSYIVGFVASRKGKQQTRLSHKDRKRKAGK